MAVKLVGVAGSLRRHSFNKGLLAAAAELMPGGATLEIAPIDAIPLYNADVEAAEGIPPAVARLKDAIAGADGLLLATPEYNNGIPGVFKNAIDWASRPPADAGRVFSGRPVALIGASPGGFGTILSQDALAAGAAHARHAAVVRGAADGVARGRAVRRRRPPDRRADARAAARFPRRLRRFRGRGMMGDRVTAHASETGDSVFAVRIRTGRHVLTGDEPEAMGGLDLGPAPYQLLASALAECTTMTVRWYARQQGWAVDHVETVVTHEKGAVEGRPGESDIFAKVVAISGDLSPDQHAKLMAIAARCPVHRTLEAGAAITTRSAEDAADERAAAEI